MPLPAVPPPPGEPPLPGPPGPGDLPPDRQIWPWLLLFAILVIGGLVVGWAATRGGDDSKATTTVTVAAQVQVPDVRGMLAADATRTLEDAGLRVHATSGFTSEPAGTVVGQSPAAGTSVATGSTVTIAVSKGERPPPATTTIGTTTTGTTTVTSTTTVTATTATVTTTAPPPPPPPPPPVAVPDVVGKSQTQARHTLKDQGLLAAVAYVHADLPFDQVVAQFPQAGADAKQGDRVRINVSLGPKPRPEAAVPDVTSQDESVAKRTVRDAGFFEEVVDRPTTDPSEDGVVVDQDPQGGSQAPVSSTVTLYVGRLASG